MFAFKCGNDSKNKLKSVCKSQSKNIKFDKYYISLFVGDYRKDCENYIIKSRNQKMYHHQVIKSTLTPFDEKNVMKVIFKCNLGFNTIN